MTLSTPDERGLRLTPAKAAARHDRRKAVAWFVMPVPSGNGVIARARTQAHDGGRLLPGLLAVGDVEGLRAMLPDRLTFDPEIGAGSPPGCLGWWWP